MIQYLKNKPLIINTDLDGLISGLILKKFLNCHVIGLSTSTEKFWVIDQFINKFKNVCFVDMYVVDQNTYSVDQHIISVNEEHHKLLSQNSKKINPNLMNNKYFLPNSSYYTKYPFGTIHFIIALLENIGIDLTSLNLKKNIENISFIDLILRCDDAMKTTIASECIRNAKNWWEWLKKMSKNGPITLSFIEYLSQIDSLYVTNKRDQITRLLKGNPFYCDSSDGGINDILEGTKIKDSTKEYFQFIAEISGIDLFDINFNYKTFKGLAKRTSLSLQQKKELISNNSINGKKIFSYAFVRSSNRENNFSYTLTNKW